MIGIGVIGYGYWGPNLVRNFSEIPGARVVVVADLRTERLAPIRDHYPAIRLTQVPGELIRDREVDAVVVATPVSTHFELARQALAAGKHVLVEKPLAASVEHAETLCDEAARRGRLLMVDHTFVYTSAVALTKKLVDDGKLGNLYYFDSARTNLGLFQQDVNVLWDLAVHDLSIMDFVCPQKPTAVTALGIAHLPGKPVNIAYLTLHFPSDFIAHIHVNWLSPVKIRRTLIGGDQQMILFDDMEPSEKIRVYDRGVTLNDGPEGAYQKLIGYRTGDVWLPQLKNTEALRTEALHFVDCISRGHTPLSDGVAGLRIVRILEAASQSMAGKGRLVELQ